MAARLPERYPLAMRARLLPARPEASSAAKPKQNWFLYAFLILLPLQNLQTDYIPNFGGGLNFLNIGFVLAFIGALRCGGTVTRWSGLRNWVVLFIAYCYLSVIIGFANVPSAGPTDDRFNSLKDQALAMLLVFIAQMSVVNWTALKRIILVTILPMPYMLRVTWDQHNSVNGWHYNDDMRISGTFSLLGANEFAAFCVTMTILFFALLLAMKWSRWWRIVLVGGIACMALGIVWTYSRTAYITVLLGGATVILLWRGRWKMILPLILVALILPGMLPVSVTERFGSTTIEEGKRDESVEMRFEFWRIAWKNFTEHPLFGSGYRTFGHHEINPFNMDTHNFFMRELTEKGLFGIAITIGLLLSIARACLRVMRESPQDNLAYALGLGMVAAWLALVVGNFFGDRFTYYPMIGYFWVYLGLTLKAYELMVAEKKVLVESVKQPVSPPVRRFAQPRKLLED